MTVIIETATHVDDDLVRSIAQLLPQLSSAPPPTAAELSEILSDSGSTIFLARLDGRIVGTLTLVTFRIPSGLKAWIEDVIVDESARGHGIGDLLNRAALDHARNLGAKAVSLTSRPSREAANRLYQRIGFVQRETNVYRYDL